MSPNFRLKPASHCCLWIMIMNRIVIEKKSWLSREMLLLFSHLKITLNLPYSTLSCTQCSLLTTWSLVNSSGHGTQKWAPFNFYSTEVSQQSLSWYSTWAETQRCTCCIMWQSTISLPWLSAFSKEFSPSSSDTTPWLSLVYLWSVWYKNWPLFSQWCSPTQSWAKNWLFLR